MKIRETCKAPWELVLFIAGIAVIGLVVATSSYLYVATAIAVVAMAYSAFWAEGEPFRGQGHDSYPDRIARFGLVLFVGVMVALIVPLIAMPGGTDYAQLHFFLISYGLIVVGIFIGWSASWCKRCIVWE